MNAKAHSDDLTREEQEEATRTERRVGAPFRIGIGIFAALGLYTAIWLIFSAHWPALIYMLIMIPVSAIGVVFLFNGFTGRQQHTVLQAIDAGIAAAEAGNAIVLGQIANVHGEVTMVRRDLNALEHRQDVTDERQDELGKRQDQADAELSRLRRTVGELTARLEVGAGPQRPAAPPRRTRRPRHRKATQQGPTDSFSEYLRARADLKREQGDGS